MKGVEGISHIVDDADCCAKILEDNDLEERETLWLPVPPRRSEAAREQSRPADGTVFVATNTFAPFRMSASFCYFESWEETDLQRAEHRRGREPCLRSSDLGSPSRDRTPHYSTGIVGSSRPRLLLYMPPLFPMLSAASTRHDNVPVDIEHPHRRPHSSHNEGCRPSEERAAC